MPRGNEAMMSILRGRDFGFVIGDVSALLFSAWKLQFFNFFKQWIMQLLGSSTGNASAIQLQQFKKRMAISMCTVIGTIVFLTNVTFAW